MSGYDKFMTPLEKLYLGQIRAEIMPEAHGQVLEIAFASGVNMKYYDFNKIDSFHALDVNQKMKKFEGVNYHVFSAEELPFEDETFDTVVLTLALCTIDDQVSAIREIKRVLKKEGIYIFLEHERPESGIMTSLLTLINPLWKRLARGCQLILESHKIIEKEGFKLTLNKKGVFHYGIAKKLASLGTQHSV